MASDVLVVLTTVSGDEAAEKLARKIVEAKLAACVQILPPMKSVYVWENAVQVETEHLLLIKTLRGGFDALKLFIQENHDYETPEIIALEAFAVADKYLEWMKNYLKS